MKVNVFIGMPAYNSMVHTDHEHSLLSFHDMKIPFTLMTIGNESLIPRGRNSVLAYFNNNTIFTHLLFLDADIYLHGKDLIRLLSYEKDVIGAPVRLKGTDKFGIPVYNTGKMLEETENGLIKTDKLGTAVFMLSRRAVDALIQDAINKADVYGGNPNTRGDANKDVVFYDVFKTGVFSGEYLSEDYYVCRTLMLLGFDIFVDPTIKPKHNGMYVFE